MDTRKEFLRLARTETDLALASCAEGAPNVRIVNFVFDEKKNVFYFATFGDNEKVWEFAKNNRVAFTTAPKNGNAHLRGQGVVKLSAHTIFDVADAFKEKIPGYDETIARAGSLLVLYEIAASQITVTLDFESIDILHLNP